MSFIHPFIHAFIQEIALCPVMCQAWVLKIWPWGNNVPNSKQLYLSYSQHGEVGNMRKPIRWISVAIIQPIVACLYQDGSTEGFRKWSESRHPTGRTKKICWGFDERRETIQGYLKGRFERGKWSYIIEIGVTERNAWKQIQSVDLDMFTRQSKEEWVQDGG